MAVGSISSHCEKDVWSGSSTRTGLMLARLAITSRTKESSNVDDRTRRGSVASKKLEENQFAKLKRVVRVLSTFWESSFNIPAFTMLSMVFNRLLQN